MPWVQVSTYSPKFKELILYVARKSEGDERFGAGKLNKILFFIDFDHYHDTGKSISGERYQRIQRGPAPVLLKPVLREMEDDDKTLTIKRVALGGPYKDQARAVALRDAKTSLFTTDELRRIDATIEKYWQLNASEIAARAYELPGVKVAGEGEEIPYQTAMISTKPWTREDTARAQRFAKKQGWAVAEPAP